MANTAAFLAPRQSPISHANFYLHANSTWSSQTVTNLGPNHAQGCLPIVTCQVEYPRKSFYCMLIISSHKRRLVDLFLAPSNQKKQSCSKRLSPTKRLILVLTLQHRLSLSVICKLFKEMSRDRIRPPTDFWCVQIQFKYSHFHF
jgi:hypothetical protein